MACICHCHNFSPCISSVFTDLIHKFTTETKNLYIYILTIIYIYIKSTVLLVWLATLVLLSPEWHKKHDEVWNWMQWTSLRFLCVCDLSHFTEDWKGKHTLARNQEKFLKPARRITTSDVSAKRACEICTVTKGWKQELMRQIKLEVWLG